MACYREFEKGRAGSRDDAARQALTAFNHFLAILRPRVVLKKGREGLLVLRKKKGLADRWEKWGERGQQSEDSNEEENEKEEEQEEQEEEQDEEDEEEEEKARELEEVGSANSTSAARIYLPFSPRPRSLSLPCHARLGR